MRSTTLRFCLSILFEIEIIKTANFSCKLSTIFFTDSNTLGNREFVNIEYKVFPNPTQDNWRVVSNNIVTNIQVFDMLGKQVLNLNPNEAVTTIDASSLKSGMYFATINTTNGTNSIKLIKQ